MNESQCLLVDYLLPAIDAVPNIKEVRYVQSRNLLNELTLSEKEVAKLYDGLIYQIVLRTLYELFNADAIEAIQSVVFNGWVNAIDPTTGKFVNACIVSLQAKRQEFLEIDLKFAEPKACFKKLKGIACSQLHSMTPIPPIMVMERNDKRFIPAHEVANQLSDSSNIAAMDWEDFEHLVREIFAKEFAGNGGEVKVTQSSRDGGVDAVAFDPDPIRGGKIVIQAKRYTHTVGVSAVRDLWGTVMHEGAMKGILVTTADFGPDAYEFIKDKPLSLCGGAQLLFLLEKHGHKARIDLKQAREILSQNSPSR